MTKITDELLPALPLAVPILNIGGTAAFLCCSVERVRRIPESELPRSRGPGKHCLFLMDDLIAYVRAQTKKRIRNDELIFKGGQSQTDFVAAKHRSKRNVS